MGQADENRANEFLRGSIPFGASTGGEGQRGSNAAIHYSSSTRQERLQNPGNNSPSSRMTLADHIQSSPDSHSDAKRNLLQRSSSPKRRSTSPLRRVQIGRSGLRRPSPVVIRSINYLSSQECSSREKRSTIGSNISDTEEDANNVSPEKTGPVRRLSVQDAISLFENKRRDSNEASIMKKESRRTSLESGDSSTSGKSVLRRWNTVNDISCVASIQQRKEMMPESQGLRAKIHSDAPRNVHSAANDPMEATGEGQHGLELKNKQGTEGRRRFSDSNLPHSMGKVRQQSQPISVNGTSAPPETSKQELSVTTESFRTLDVEWQKQFKMELARSLAREVDNGGAPNMTAPPRSEANSGGLDPSTQNDLTMNDGDARSAEGLGAGSVGGASDSAASQEHANVGRRRVKQPEPELTVLKETDSTSSRELSHVEDVRNSGDTEGNSSIKAEEMPGRESFGSSWNAPLDFDMQALVSMADQQHISDQPGSDSGDDVSPSGQRGRFYEQYRKIRDAKLREEHVSKRVEREAKLKAMEETLEKRKAELEARNVSLSTKKNTPMMKAQQIKAEKPRASKGDSLFPTMQEQNNEEGIDKDDLTAQAQDWNNPHISPTSPSSMPRAPNNHHLPAPRPQDCNKKIVPSSQKSASTPLSSTRPPTSSSPRFTPKNPARTPNHRKSAVLNQSGILDNPLSRSVPCFADLRKENTKPSPGRIAGSARQPTKTRNNYGHPQTVGEAVPLELTGNISALGAIPPLSTGKEDNKKPRSALTRKSYATANELKALSVQGQEGTVLSPLKVQREGNSKIRRSAVAPIQEVKPFLRKGHGIGPGAGPGVMKQKASAAVDMAKSSDEDTPATPSANLEAVNPENQEEGETQGSVDSGERPTVDYSEGGLGSELGASSNFEAMNASDCYDDSPGKLDIVTVDGLSENVSINVETCHKSPPNDSLTQKHHTSFTENLNSLSDHSLADVALINQEDRQAPAPLPQILDQISTDSGHGQSSSINASSSFRASSLPRELITTPFSPAPSSPFRTSMILPGTSDHFGPPVAALVSPLGSPASWNSSQIQYASEADLPRSQKKWGGSQKPVLIINQPLKEPAKGLKRLLKFGRKSRRPETATTEWVSASTTSEGDDDPEEPRDLWSRSADELVRRAKLQERKLEFGSTVVSGEPYGTQEQGTVQSLRSSIPAPPANFKLREDHLSGVSLLKAPRSFFSLSSFRSRGNEGKSR